MNEIKHMSPKKAVKIAVLPEPVQLLLDKGCISSVGPILLEMSSYYDYPRYHSTTPQSLVIKSYMLIVITNNLLHLSRVLANGHLEHSPSTRTVTFQPQWNTSWMTPSTTKCPGSLQCKLTATGGI